MTNVGCARRKWELLWLGSQEDRRICLLQWLPDSNSAQGPSTTTWRSSHERRVPMKIMLRRREATRLPSSSCSALSVKCISHIEAQVCCWSISTPAESTYLTPFLWRCVPLNSLSGRIDCRRGVWKIFLKTAFYNSCILGFRSISTWICQSAMVWCGVYEERPTTTGIQRTSVKVTYKKGQLHLRDTSMPGRGQANLFFQSWGVRFL